MYPETLNATYETLTNPILRLMLYGCASIIVVLAGTVAFLYRERQVLQREMIQANFDAIGALNNVAKAIEALRDEVEHLKSLHP